MSQINTFTLEDIDDFQDAELEVIDIPIQNEEQTAGGNVNHNIKLAQKVSDGLEAFGDPDNEFDQIIILT